MRITTFILILCVCCRCTIIDPPEKIPSFIKIDAIDLQINNSNEGSAQHAIVDAWVYIDGNLEGIYELPAEKIPLIHDGEHELKVFAGIKKNGISGDREKYSFFTSYTQNIYLIPDSIIAVFPVVEYEDNLFIWIEDFEDPSAKFESTPLSDTTLYIIDNPAEELFEGDAGAVSMSANNFLCELRTDELNFNNFPTNMNIPCYLEMHYKCNHPFTVGILHKTATSPYLNEPLITLNPTLDNSNEMQWNKTYLYLSDVTNFHPASSAFDVYFSIINPTQQDNIEIRLDNIKIIYRN